MMELDKTYHKVKKVMTDTFQEIMDNIKAWLNAEFATFANPRNTYTGSSAGGDLKPVIYDYIFHKKNVRTNTGQILGFKVCTVNLIFFLKILIL